MKNKKYCILNKQYTKEERFRLAEEIFEKLKAEGIRGEFFPVAMSPFPYNDTVAIDYSPVTEKQLEILEPDKFISDALLDLG
ncbi:hypothetical protein KKH82_04685 [Patescibacteria group bacterium]|nr:hypothetical protein [Patescibacteria group bacterium]MBU1627729.1 hypothetical protein [bacterium]